MMGARAKFILIALISLFGIDLHAQGIPYQLNPPAPNARVQFCPVPDGGYPCPTLTTVYSDSAATQVINQPISTGSSGNLSVYFAAGTSSVTVQLLGQGYGPQNRFVTGIGGGGTPGGTNGQIQYNNNGAFGGTTATWNGSQFLSPSGSTGAPSYSFTAQTGTGMSFNAAVPELDINVNGGRQVAIGPSFVALIPSSLTIGSAATSGFTSSASGALVLNAANRFKLIDQGQCTMAAGTCAVQSFASTYAAAPLVFITWTGTGTCTGVLKAPSTTTTTTPASSVGTDTCQVNWIAFGN